MIKDVIKIDPEIMSGAPVFNGTRVPIKNLFDYLESGESINDFLNDFPSVPKEYVLQILENMESVLTSNKMQDENLIG
jgi:uncharacterized protein (DUF433 family)